MTHRRLLSFALLSAALSTAALADIRYVVTAAPNLSSIRVEIEAESKGTAIDFRIPNFAPGHYVLLSQAQQVTELKATTAEGLDTKVDVVDPNTWRVGTPNGGKVKFSYTLPIRSTANGALMQGPYYYMYVVDRKEEKCHVQFVGTGTTKFAVSLEPQGGANSFVAPDYDVLADCPVTIGEFNDDTYTVRGVPHHIITYGAGKDTVDRKKLLAICKRTTEIESDLMGDIPYKRYFWHLGVSNGGGGGGGLEHLSSTNITMGNRITPGTISLFTHEFFHLWNVKRTRSKVLGPFDYQVIPKTGALWWLEGVTDYYASLMCIRGGMWTQSDFESDMFGNLDAVRRRPERLTVSIYDSSYRVGEAAGGRGNSAGFGQNYYNAGWVAGFCLDMEIRSRTQGRRSLDDVMKALYAICKDGKPGFEEDEIRKQLIRFGGQGMGEIYDTWIMKPGEIPFEAQLARAGYKVDEFVQRFGTVGFTAVSPEGDKGMKPIAISGPAEGKILADDTVLSINGKALGGATQFERTASFRNATADLKPGQALKIVVLRGGAEATVEFAAGERTQPGRRMERIDFGNKEMLAVRAGWLDAKMKWLPEATPAP